MRIGQGFDIHPFSDDAARPLVLGGITVPGPGLAGHSDADVAAHAVTDALLGAAGLGDIGRHFPDTDPRWKGASSMAMMTEVMEKIVAAGYVVGNVDMTLVLEAPVLAPYVADIEQSIGAVVRAPVSVKAKRAERLGALGRREGIACLAVALLLPSS